VARNAARYLSLKTHVDTATNVRGVIGDDAVLDSKCPGIEDAAALVGFVTEDRTVNDLKYPGIEDAAAC